MEELFKYVDNEDFFTVYDAVVDYIGVRQQRSQKIFNIFKAYMDFWDVEGF